MKPIGATGRVLLVRLSALGDCIHAVPVVEELRRQRPELHVGWVIEQGAHGLLRGYRGVDRFHIYPRRVGARRFASEIVRLRRELRAERYDVALDVQGLTKSGLVAWLSGARRRISFAPPGGRELNRWFVNERISVPNDVRHVVDRNLTLLAALGLQAPGTPRWSLEARAIDGDETTRRFLRGAGLAVGGFAVLNPGAAWPTKLWSSAGFAELARGLLEQERLAVVLSWGSEAERRRAREIASLTAHERCFVAPSTSLPELSALIRAARLFVGGDTGPLHLAVALGVPTIGLFGPTDPARTGPYGKPGLAVSLEPRLDCQPCHKRRCARGDLACLLRLEPDRVLAACRQKLQASES